MSKFEPLLASAIKTDKDWDKIERKLASRHLIATPKLDGIRVIKKDGAFYSRSDKLIRNAHIQSFAHLVPDGLDGEILTYSDPEFTQMKDFNKVQSDVMNSKGEPFFLYHVFDDFTSPTMPYVERLKILQAKIENNRLCRYVPTMEVHTKQEMLNLVDFQTDAGWEGTMFRDPFGPYKFGRSSLTQGILMKVKKFDDDEGKIVGFQQFKSAGSKVPHPLRVKHFEDLGIEDDGSEVMLPMVGAIVCRWKGVTFDIGTGLKMDERENMWKNRDSLEGELVKFKFQGVGTHGRPRFPIYVAIRDEDDMS